MTSLRLALGMSVVAAAFAAATPGTARAQAATTEGAAVPASAPVTLVNELPKGSRIDEAQLLAAIANELGVAVVRDPASRGGTLRVRLDGLSVTVTFDGPGGRHDERRFVPDSTTVPIEQEVALVAMNVARDQAAPFRVSPAPPPPPPPAVSVATPAPVPPARRPTEPGSPCERLRASRRPRETLGVDFVPYAGTSAFDGRQVRTLSIGALGALSGGINGVAASGLVNAEAGPVCGAEVAGLVNIAAGVQGVQASGIANVTSGDSTGLQVSLVDVATGRLSGSQIGLVGVAHAANVQVGLVNVAGDADVQVGLVNIDLHGRVAVDAWSKPEAGTLLFGVKHGPPHSHSIYAFEVNAATGRPWAAFGLGAHVTPARRLSIDIDLLQHVELLTTSAGPDQLSELRVLLGYELLPHATAFAGPTYNVLVATDPGRADAPGYASLLASDAKTAVRAWPGAAIGLEIP